MLLLTACGGGGSSTSGDGFAQVSAGTAAVQRRTGPIVAVRVGEIAMLDGTNSIATSSVNLTYDWSFNYKPDGSNAVLQNPTTATPSFTADARGVYMVQLKVTGGGITSVRDIQMVVATVAPERVTGPFNHPGLSSDCVNCHNGVLDRDPVNDPGGQKILGKTATHVATSNSCETCHSPLGFDQIPYVDHLEVFGSCSQCHNGVLAIGKSPFHIETNAECDECHNTTAFLDLNPDGTFDHSGITRACQGCHNDTIARGQDQDHIATTTDCGFCHTTRGFLPAYPDHTGPDVVGKRCDSCHNDSIAAGPIPGHPVVNVDCEVCHSTTGFSMNGIFDHGVIDASVQPCSSCHNDTNSIKAPGMSVGHPATNGQDCGVCHNTTNFADATFDHTGRVDNCVECHGNPATIPSQQATTYNVSTHLTPIQDCSACHTPGTFATGVLDHATSPEVTTAATCASCHDDSISIGKGVNHLPTTEDCGVCHNTTAFVPTPFDHLGIDTNNCALCHNDNIAIGKPLNHVPTAEDCSSCHTVTDFTTFAGILYNHFGIDTNNCAQCHNTGIAPGKITNHIPADTECSICHDSTSTFTSNTFLTSVHNGLPRGCEGCHTAFFLPGTPPVRFKQSTHLPTSQDCYFCHTISAFSPASNFSHTGITGNCASCHNGGTNNIAAGAVGEPNDLVHTSINSDCSICHNTAAFIPQDVDHSRPDILSVRCDTCHNGNFPGIPGKNALPGHVATTSDCSVCHNTTTFVGGFIDHDSPQVQNARCDSCHNGTDATGKVDKANHIPTSSDCDVCHIAGASFKPSTFSHQGITGNCATCHNGTFSTGMSVGHVPIGPNQDCSACHNTNTFSGANFDHTGIVDNCASCHNGSTAPGQIPPPNHVPTNQDCHACHQTTGFLPASFDHTGIVDNCSFCHAAGFATGKSSSHIATNQDCGVCHNTSTFVGAVFDHTGIVDNCESCHDGNTAKGKADAVPAHIATSLDCHFCHTTATFVGGTWVHDGSTAGNCDSCHNNNGGGATGKPNGHLSTTEQCDVCHNTNGWAPTTFSHDPNGNYPGDHHANPGCSQCHGNTISSTIPWSYPQYEPDCAGCHANDYKSGVDKHNGLSNDRNCGQSRCHSVTERKWN